VLCADDERMHGAYKDIGLGVFLTAVSLIVLFWLIPVGIQSPGNIKEAVLAPAFWPQIIVAGLVVLGGVLAAQGVLCLRRIRQGVEERAPPVGRNVLGNVKAVAAIALLFAYYWSMIWGGIVVPSILAIIVYTALHGERRIHYYGPLGIVFTLALYYFFLKVAQVPMPLGIFEGWLP